MSMFNGSNQSSQSHHKISGNEFDHIKKNLSKVRFIECIVEGLLNVLSIVKDHDDFQVPIPIEDLNQYGLLGADRKSLLISNQNKQQALNLCTPFYKTIFNDIETNLNNSVSLTTFFISKSCRMFDRLSNTNCSHQSFEELSFSNWRLSYTNAVHALKANKQPNLDNHTPKYC